MPKVNNITLFNMLRKNPNSAFYGRIPEATMDNLNDIAKTIDSYKPLQDEMTGEIVSKIGMQIYQEFDEFINPLAIFDKGELPYGRTIEEIYMGLLPARAIDREDGETDVLKRVKADIKTLYHSINIETQYKVTIDRNKLREVVLAEYGVFDWLYGVFTSRMFESAEWDKYITMLKTLNLAVAEGIRVDAEKTHSVDVLTIPDTTGTDLGDRKFAKDLLKAIRTVSDQLAFYDSSTISGVDNISAIHNQVLITTPEVKNTLDVEVLASVINMSHAESKSRLCVVSGLDTVEIDGVERDVLAVITHIDLLQYWEYYKQLEPEVYNPANMARNIYLNNIAIDSYSKFANMVVFVRGDKPDTQTVIEDQTETPEE